MCCGSEGEAVDPAGQSLVVCRVQHSVQELQACLLIELLGMTVGESIRFS